MDPEEALGGDELEGFVERHDLAAEGAWVAPGLASPPQHPNLVALAGRAQPSDGAAGAQAAERVALAHAHHLDAAAAGRPGVGLDAGAHLVGAAGHGRLFPIVGHVLRLGDLGGGGVPWRRAWVPRCWTAGCGPSDATSPRPSGVTCSCWWAAACWHPDGGRSPRRCGSWGSARLLASRCTIAC